MRHFVISRSALVSACVSICGLLAPFPNLALPPQAPAQKLTLKNSEAMALRNHPLLQEATFEAQAANQITREEKSTYYPTATGSITGAGALSRSEERRVGKECRSR